MTIPALGPLVQSFFADHLQAQKGLRPASVRSYRDVLRLFLCFVAQQARRKITKLTLEALTLVFEFLFFGLKLGDTITLVLSSSGI